MPPEYGRVTDPERFRPLHVRAGTLVEELTRAYDVRREDVAGDAALSLAAPGQSVEQAVRLVPASGLPVVLVMTAFPSVRVVAGPFQADLPDCGCDGCADDVDDLVVELEEVVSAIAAGGVVERVSRRETEVRLVTGDGWRATGDAGPRARERTWPAWPRRGT